MMGHGRWVAGLAVAALVLAARIPPASGQQDAADTPPEGDGLAAPLRPDLTDRLVELGGIPSPTGEEAPLREALVAALAGAGAAHATDGLGNLLIGLPAGPRPGAGARPLLVLMPLDDPTYAVSDIEDGGWLRLAALDLPGPPPVQHRHLAGSLVWVMGEAGAVPGVLALPSIHLQRGREGFPPAAEEELLHVDVGAGSPAEVRDLGIERLDRVVPRMLPARLGGGRVAGFGMGRRAAALAAVEAAGRQSGLPPLVLVAQSRFRARGLESLAPILAAWGEAGGAVVVLEPARTGGDFLITPVGLREPGDAGFSAGARAVADGLVAAMARVSVPQRTFVAERIETEGETATPSPWPLPAGVDGVRVRFPVERPGTLGETVDVRTVVALADLLGGMARPQASQAGPHRPGGGRDRDATGPGHAPWEAPVRIFPADPTLPFAHLPALIEAVGVSGDEEEVRDTVRRLLPARYAGQAREDASGNLLLDLGSGSPHLLFIAHLDETGYQVAAVDPDGRLQVAKRGGFYDSAVVDRPVWVHRAGQAPAEGVLVRVPGEDPSPAAMDTPPPLVETYPAERLRVDLGVSSAAGVAALGIAAGDAVTVRKQLQPLGDHRAAGRAVDDRAGCAALLAALHRLARAPAAEKGLTGRVTFAWVTREEIGLEGAAELAAGLRPDMVFAVDTFVSSDSPLERRWFSHAALGEGAVLRAADSSNLTPLWLVRSVRRAAAAAGIPLQSGVGRGGNDGSVFARHGVPDLPLSWPGRYSHSAVEVIDSRDHDALADLILLLATEPTEIQAK